ncbi:RipA family octameric membrane protein [Streptomyces violascens]|uniref:RipA family octameric membrane protein n=1 Tax=Streptomyces violascens TaxID=67381 RepID=UPI0036B5B397
MAEISEALWNEDVTESDYGVEKATYHAAVFEQYKLCVEMADRVSARRNLANTFFLTLHSGLVAFLGAWLSQSQHGKLSVLLLLSGLLVLVALCTAWWFTLSSYRQLNDGKFQVIGALEERLPARAFHRAEWEALGRGRDWRAYLPLTHVERWIPVIFASTYLLGCIALAV